MWLDPCSTTTKFPSTISSNFLRKFPTMKSNIISFNTQNMRSSSAFLTLVISIHQALTEEIFWRHHSPLSRSHINVKPRVCIEYSLVSATAIQHMNYIPFMLLNPKNSHNRKLFRRK